MRDEEPPFPFPLPLPPKFLIAADWSAAASLSSASLIAGRTRPTRAYSLLSSKRQESERRHPSPLLSFPPPPPPSPFSRDRLARERRVS